MIEYRTNKRYKIGLVGAGYVSNMHLNGMDRYSDIVEIHAVCDPVEENRLQKSTTYNIPHSFASVEEMIEGTLIDAAVVCTPTFLREKVLEQLIKARIPVFCEKPVAQTYESALKIAGWSEKYKIPIAVNQNFRRFFTFCIGRDMLQKGELGRPLHITHAVNSFRLDKGWRLELERYVMAVMSIHWFDGYRFLLHDEAETVYCRGIKNESGQDIAISTVIQFKKGTVVSLTESFNSRTNLKGCTLDCENGGMIFNYNQLVEVDSKGVEKKVDNPYDASEATFYLMYDLLRSLEEKRRPETDIFDNVNSLKLMEAAYRSLNSGSVIIIDQF